MVKRKTVVKSTFQDSELFLEEFMKNTEQPDYKVVMSKMNIEVRDYSPMIVAEVEVSGARKVAIRAGFTILADYIFGNNTPRKKTEICSVIKPVGEKISMTTPVMQERHLDQWKVRFIMPKKYSLETLPRPNSKHVTFFYVPPKRFVVIRFSGLVDDEDIKKHVKKLNEYILTNSLTPIREPILAFYTPPWTLPFLRRNEIMIEVGMNQ